MSRARERTDLYFTASSFDEAIGRQPESDLVRWLSTSRAKHLAVESLQPGRTAAAATVEVQRLATGDDSFVAQSDQPVRHAEMAVAASMAEGLLGEAAAQRTPNISGRCPRASASGALGFASPVRPSRSGADSRAGR
jgi:hypothetical protein